MCACEGERERGGALWEGEKNGRGKKAKRSNESERRERNDFVLKSTRGK